MNTSHKIYWKGENMGTFVNILLDILSILAIIIFGALVIVVVADLILCLFDGHQGIIFNRNKKDKNENGDGDRKSEVKKDDIVVYSNQANPNGNYQEEKEPVKKEEEIDGDKIQEIDYDKAVEEQKALQAKNAPRPAPAPVKREAPKKVETAPVNDDIFWDNDEDEEFNKMLDSVIKEAKKTGAQKEEKKEVVAPVEKKDDKLNEETRKELEELKALKAQQEKELEDFKKLKEDFAREKEEQLAIYKDNLDKIKQEEIEKIRQDALKEQEKLDKMREDLEKEQEKLEEEQAKLKQEAKENKEPEPIVQQTVIKDEEEINKMKYKNLVRMNNRLTRIIRDTEKLTAQKQKEMEKAQREKERLLEKERLERIKEQERQNEIERQQKIERERLERLEQEEKQRQQERLNEIKKQNQERLLKQQEEIKKRNEIARMYSEASKREGKYKLDSKVVKITKEVEAPIEERVVEETVITTTQTIPHSNTAITTVEKTPMKSTAKPLFDKEYYEAKLQELEEELRDAEKELRLNKTEYLPLTRIYKAYDRDSEKLRKKEMQVAKQKVSLYGVSGSKVDPEKKAKLDENLQSLAELKDSVAHCEEVIRKNKDRYPVLEKNNQLINKQIARITDDMKVCEKAISYYNKKKD